MDSAGSNKKENQEILWCNQHHDQYINNIVCRNRIPPYSCNWQ